MKTFQGDPRNFFVGLGLGIFIMATVDWFLHKILRRKQSSAKKLCSRLSTIQQVFALCQHQDLPSPEYTVVNILRYKRFLSL